MLPALYSIDYFKSRNVRIVIISWQILSSLFSSHFGFASHHCLLRGSMNHGLDFSLHYSLDAIFLQAGCHYSHIWLILSNIFERVMNNFGIVKRWCERCLLITESPKTPGHYRCPRLQPLYGIGGVQFCDFSCSCVYCDFDFLQIRVLNALK